MYLMFKFKKFLFLKTIMVRIVCKKDRKKGKLWKNLIQKYLKHAWDVTELRNPFRLSLHPICFQIKKTSRWIDWISHDWCCHSNNTLHWHWSVSYRKTKNFVLIGKTFSIPTTVCVLIEPVTDLKLIYEKKLSNPEVSWVFGFGSFLIYHFYIRGLR